MQDYEKLGLFYVGKKYDMQSKTLSDDLVLYKSKDLTTHAVIIGMTGSGKTGLGIGLLEEAAIDHIPVIAIDPKGDLGNMALTFPQLRGEDFRPWINVSDAANKGQSPEAYAQAQAELWKKGLSAWGQDGARIEKLQQAADICVYTPGSSAGRSVSALRSFAAPPGEMQQDQDAYRERIHTTVTSLLALVGIQDDPLTSREHILLSGIVEHAWGAARDLGLETIIQNVQNPPFEKIGVMDLESFYPAKDRFALAMRLNGILAAPGFKAWMEGEPLDVDRFLHGRDGRPRVSVFSIAHLSDSERMFFVTMLLNEVLAWARAQSGTGSLRAILYMDEIFGYLPPTANPPSKMPLMTLLKQARAYGLGIVLATQNPVDLDYKALSNTGTWFIGRLQTERDKARVLAGLEGAAAGGSFDRRRTEEILAGLGQRTFYLHSVHEEEAVIFQTRWVLSYLAGPLTRDQIAALPTAEDALVKAEAAPPKKASIEAAVDSQPILPPQIQQVFLPGGIRENTTYIPHIIGAADVLYTQAKHGISANKRHVFLVPLHEGPVAVEWKDAWEIDMDLRDLDKEPVHAANFSGYPNAAADVKNYDIWRKQFNQFLRSEGGLALLSYPPLKMVAEPEEDERDFHIRLQHVAHERRDQQVESIRKKYASRMNTLEDRRRRAVQAVEKQSVQSRQKKLDAAVSTGTALLGALFGSKKISATSVSKVGTAVRSANRAKQSGEGIAQAQENLQAVENQLAELEMQLQQEVDKAAEMVHLAEDRFETIRIRPTAGRITIQMLALAWVPQP